MGEIEQLAAVPPMGAAFARALLPRRKGLPARVPDRTVAVSGLSQDRDRLADYDRVCGFGLRDQVPPTWLHVLTFGLQVHLLTGRDSTISVAGVVHVANRMTQHRPVDAGEALDLSVRAGNLRPHRRGALVDLVGEVRVAKELVWRGTSTYLSLGAAVGGEVEAGQPAEFFPQPPIARWRLPARLGAAYRRVSGDPNPIHTSRLAARAFGFDRPIIHGMWTHARLLAALAPRLPDRYTVSVDFVRPILLPATVGAWWRPEGGGWQAAVTTADGTKAHLLAEVTPVGSGA